MEQRFQDFAVDSCEMRGRAMLAEKYNWFTKDFDTCPPQKHITLV